MSRALLCMAVIFYVAAFVAVALYPWAALILAGGGFAFHVLGGSDE